MRTSKSPPRVNDPERLRRFLDQLESADSQGDSSSALAKIFSALSDLVYCEIIYYYNARKKQRTFSILTRSLSILLGTVGVLLPLIASAEPERLKFLGPYGYPFLVAAAATLAVNRMFGATGGHIRYMTTQLALERLMTKFHLRWSEQFSQRKTQSPDADSTHQAFAIMNEFADEVYRVIEEETVTWGKSVLAALQEHERRLPALGTGSHGPTNEPR